MDDGNTFRGAALGATFLLNGLLKALVVKRVFTEDEMGAVFDATLLTLERAQAGDIVENAELWAEARKHVEQVLQAHVEDWEAGAAG